MLRTLGIPVGIVALVGIPFAVSKPTEPQPRESALTVKLSGAEGESGKSPAYVHVLAAGDPPRSGELTDSTGEHAASVSSSPRKCPGAPRRVGVSAQSGTKWCLKLISVDPGVTLTGTLSAADPPAGSEFTKLTLTAMRRDDFMPMPLLTIIAGLIFGVLAIVVPLALRSNVKRIRLARLLDGNRRADAKDQIAGLDGWVQDRVRDGKTVDDLLDPVGRTVKFGPERARVARAKLGDALDQSALTTELAFVEHARAQQREKQNHVSDFLNDDASTLTKHPTAEWTDAVAILDKHVRELTRHQWTVSYTIADACRERAQAEVDSVRAHVATAGDPVAVADLAGPMNTLAAKIRGIREQPGCERDPPAGVAPLAAEAAGIVVEAPVLDLSGDWLSAKDALAITAGIVVAVAIVAYAGISLYFNAYDPKPSFHAFGADYLALFAAALGSGAAGAVIELLGYWKPELTVGIE